MAEAQLQQFLDKVRQLNAFVALTEADARLRQELRDCAHHDQVVALARRCGFEIGRRWGEPFPQPAQLDPSNPSVENPAAGRFELAATLPSAAGEALNPVAAERSVRPEAPGSRGQAAASPDGGVEQGAEESLQLAGPEAARSLLNPPCPPAGEERTELLLQTPQWRLERIHSCAHRSPDGFWYEQQEDEWVVLLQGGARLRFADQASDLVLRAGDSLTIRAGRRHRVVATDPAPGTIWLALFWQSA
jgi:nif11/cupin domain protein